MSRPVLYSQLSDAQRDAMIRIFAKDHSAIALLLEVHREVERHARQLASPIQYASAISDVLVNQRRAVADIARVLHTVVPAAFHDPVVGALLRESLPRSAAPAPAEELATTYAQLTPVQRNAMVMLFGQGRSYMLASLLSVSREVEQHAPPSSIPEQHAFALSWVLVTRNTPLKDVAAAFALVYPAAFLDSYVGPMLQNARPSTATPAPPARERTTMYDVPGPVLIELQDFFASPETGGARTWLARFGADGAVRGQLAHASPDNMARALVNYLQQQAYPLSDLARLVVHHVPAAIRDPDLGEFFRVHAGKPPARAAPTPAARSSHVGALPGPVRVELVDFFADANTGGIRHWLDVFGATSDVLAQLPPRPSAHAQALALLGVLSNQAYPVSALVEAVLEWVPEAEDHPVLGKFFKENRMQ